jgi:hypothetical protein
MRLMVDTGCTRTGFDDSLRPFLGDSLGRTSLTTSAGIVKVDEFEWPKVELSGRPINSGQPIFCQDMSELRTQCGEDFAGVLGMDVLRKYVVQIDFDEGVLRLLTELPRSSEGLGVDCDIINGVGVAPLLQLACGPFDRLFLIDTGSTNTCIDQDTFNALLKAGEIVTGNTHSVATAAGSFVTRVGLLHRLSLGQFVHEDLLCDSDSMCILGLRYLSRYHVTLDFPRSKAYLHEGLHYAKSDPRGMCGIRPVRTPRGFVIKVVAPQGPASDAGIQVDDEILEINGESTSGMDMFRIGELLTTSPGRVVRMILRRRSDEVRISLIVGERIPQSD